MKSFAAVSALALITAVSADCLVDDFKVADLRPLTIENPPPMRYFNLLGGDYGIKIEEDKTKFSELKVVADPVNGYMDFIAAWGPDDTSESANHPGKPNSHNYVYAKFDLNTCFDLSPYTAIQFDLVAPEGAEMTFGLTQSSANCTEFPALQGSGAKEFHVRLIDSEYTNLSKYITPDGSKKTVTLPLADFSKNLIGEAFDMKHLKDLTIIDIKPDNFRFQLSNLQLIGAAGCPALANVTSNTSNTSTTTTAATATTTSNSQKQIIGFAVFLTMVVSLF